VVNRIKGVHGGSSPQGPEAWHVATTGGWSKYEHSVGEIVLERQESIVSLSAGGGGYGPPLERDPELVLTDVVDGYVSAGRARDVYGVVLAGDPARWETLSVDPDATRALRAQLGPLDLAADDAARAPQPELDWFAVA
jgi:N-methylhydantoinase B/oxoprolinase/acetone carboxylase alpha subunit